MGSPTVVVDAPPEREKARPAVAAFLSAIIPGAGQWYVGRRLRAWLFVLPAIVFLGVLAFAYTRGPLRLLELLVQPRVLWALLVVNLALLAWRLIALFDAFRIANGREWPGWITSAIVVFLAAAVAVPHIVVTTYGLEAIDLIESVFTTEDTSPGPRPGVEAVGRAATLSSGPTREAVAISWSPSVFTTRNLLFRDGVGDPDAIAAYPKIIGLAEPVQIDAMIPFEEADDLDRITILIAGGDRGPGRGGLRTDSIIVATIDTNTGKAALFGLPRNLAQFPLPEIYKDRFIDFEQQMTPYSVRRTWTDEDGDGEPDQFRSCECYPDQINSIYPYSRTWSDIYPDEPDPGMAALRDAVELIVGLDIDFYAMVDMSGFVSVIDALGGVRVYATGSVVGEYSPARAGEDWIEVEIYAGWNRLNGHEALAYVRERRSVGDYVRMKRQRCLLKAVAARAEVGTVMRRFSRLSNALKRAVTTDIPVDLLPDLIEVAAVLDYEDIATVGFAPPDWVVGSDHKNHPVPDIPKIRAMVEETLTTDVDTVFATGRDSECRV